MMRVAFWGACLLIVIGEAAVVKLFAQTPASDRANLPNIVYILADDLGYGDVSCYNTESKINTVHIDQLAAAGMRFTDAHTSSSVCTPTRYSILTGRYNWRSTLKRGVLSGYSSAMIPPDRLTVGELLQSVGYHTAFIGKWHLGWDWYVTGPEGWESDRLGVVKKPEVDFHKPVLNGPNERGFSYAFGFSGSLDMPPYVYVENGMATSVPIHTTVSVDDKGFWRRGLTAPDFRHADVLPDLTSKAVQYIQERKSHEQPFFLYFALPAPHTPILPRDEFLGMSNTNFYGDFVLQVDHVVGRIMQVLEQVGLEDNTIVIFTSDNGCSPKANFAELKRVGHHPSYIFRGHKADIYEGGHRVPFIVRWPGHVARSRVSDEIICTTDFMATVADIAGTSLPDDAAEDSYSFLPALVETDPDGPVREAIVHHSIHGRFAIRKGDWKLILWPGSGGWSYPATEKDMEGMPEFQLYNLNEDPSEKHNRVDTHAEKVAELASLLLRYIDEGRSTPGKAQVNEGMSDWAQLSQMRDQIKGHIQ